MGPKRRLPALQALLALSLLLVACGGDDAPEVAATTTSTTAAPCSDVEPGETRVDVGDRWYLRHVPPAHDGRTRLPLLVDLHGYSEGATLHAGVTQWGAYGDTHEFVTVTPNGLGDPPQWDLTVDGADARFVADVIHDAETDLCIDTTRVFVTGHSMGGFLISYLACSEVADEVTAFAPVAGVRLVDGCTPARPALVIHATGDGTVLFTGGLSAEAARILGLPADGPSIEAIVDAWPGAELRIIDGGSHEWPRSANDWIWDFFADQAA
jgi:polyhydroxybutyrate depolymerase